jgi:hypothetical protein
MNMPLLTGFIHPGFCFYNDAAPAVFFFASLRLCAFALKRRCREWIQNCLALFPGGGH